MTVMAHPAESTHWYTREGAPKYTVTAKAGHERPATLSDARKLDLVPGVSAILNCAARPGLERWKADQLLLAGLTLPRREGEPESDWITRVYADSREQAASAAERGTAIHAELEAWYGSGQRPRQFPLEVQAVVDLLAVKFPDEKWEAERSFCSPDGYGGKIDLCSEATILDFKTKAFDETDDPTKLAFDEHCMQLAAYENGLGGAAPMVCGNVFVSTSVPGLVHLHVWEEAELTRGYAMFSALLDYWQHKNRYQTQQL